MTERDAMTTTVAEVAQNPRALEVLERLRVNHCCGAHLSLGAAAAAAGVPLPDLLRELEAALTVTVDVRGLEPPQPLLRVLASLDSLAEGEQMEVRLDRRPMLLYPHLDARGFTHVTEDGGDGGVRVLIARARAA